MEQPTSGPQPAYVPSASIQLPSLSTLIALTSLILTFVGGYANYKVMSAEVDRQHGDIVVLQQQAKEDAKAHIETNSRVQRTEDNYANILTSLSDLKNDVRRLRNPNYVDRGTP